MLPSSPPCFIYYIFSYLTFIRAVSEVVSVILIYNGWDLKVQKPPGTFAASLSPLHILSPPKMPPDTWWMLQVVP